MDWLETAHKVIPGHVPRVVATDRERGAFAMEYVPSQGTWKQQLLAGHVDARFGVRVAECIATVHQATARSAAMQQRFANDGTFYLIRLEPYLVETARVHPDLARQLIALVAVTQSTSLALVHGDVSPKNILLGQAGPVLLDAECAWYGDPAFDLAFLLNHVMLKSAHLPQHEDAFASLFEAMSGAYLAKVDWEEGEAFDRRCARLLPGLLLARVDGKSPVEYLDEPTRDAVRQAARQLLQDPPVSLGQLLRRWRGGA
jgi:aminoglycoside phosphotransferase (APT) family kinase protein